MTGLPVMLRCDVGGGYFKSDNGPHSAAAECRNEPAVRYRTSAMVAGHWQYRCDQHALLLSRAVCTVEPLAVAP